MRLHLGGDVSASQFSDLLLKLSNGDYPENYGMMAIASHLCTSVTTVENLISKITHTLRSSR
ncbi:unnamed protein product [Chilo suppressalis]|uniref:Uncharacterized protein n=1 Tax=Chilo suppressalis TaxID=168631 RepID=A0ABN8B625_CHISP|nr:unnamed protein product [Chilo suppressalis]